MAMPDKDGRTLMRQFVNPANPQTTYQVQQRSFLTNIGEAMQQLSLPQVEGWKAIAETIERSGRLGLSYKIKWNQLFSMVNSYRLNANQVIVTTAPAFTPVAVPTGITGVISDDGDPIQNLVVTLSESGTPPASFVFFEFTRDLGSTSRSARDNEFQAVDFVPDNIKARDTSSPYQYSITSERLNLIGGMRIGVRATILTSNYYPIAKITNRNIECTSP